MYGMLTHALKCIIYRNNLSGYSILKTEIQSFYGWVSVFLLVSIDWLNCSLKINGYEKNIVCIRSTCF